ncbi:SDR family oxidoreductase [Cryomorphaceae bacterium]|nr:SDR family oxidoreductase [Cryomorphaceae bacterium]
MKVVLTGANGYIGRRLLDRLVRQGHEVYCFVRSRNRLMLSPFLEDRVHVFETDFLRPLDQPDLPREFDAAYYLVHSMTSSTNNFAYLEEQSAHHFIDYINDTSCRQLIYLGGIYNAQELSDHLESRQNVERILSSARRAKLTALRAGIIVGSGSASFEIIRDLVEKLPAMVAPKWLNTRCQPIAIRDVLAYLSGVLGVEETYGNSYDIGGPDILTYREMLLQCAEVRGMKRWIWTVPVMTPKLSSYWLYFVTRTSYKLAINLVDSMKVEVVAEPNNLDEFVPGKRLHYKEAVDLAFQRIKQNEVVSSWKDAVTSSLERDDLHEHVEVPTYGCFIDKKVRVLDQPGPSVKKNIWSIGGETGWYYGNTLWRFRGFLDKLVGGVGLRRGRRSAKDLWEGDALDFWRVLIADEQRIRLLLYAEMKLPGEAWLEWKIIQDGENQILEQTATFRPWGLLGRLYWYAVLPFHYFVFNGMIDALSTKRSTPDANHS